MKRYIATAIAGAAILAAPAFAQEFGESAYPADEPMPIQEAVEQILSNTSDLEGQPLGGDYVEVVEKLDEPVPEPAGFVKPSQLLGQYLEAKGYSLAWDEAKGRLISYGEIEFDVEDPEISDDFVVERSLRMEQCLIRAKASLIETIKSTMTAKRMMEIPGNPLSQKFDPQIKMLREDLRRAYVALQRANVDMEFEIERQKSYSPAQLAEFAESLLAKFNIVDTGSVAAQLSAEQKASLDASRAKVREAQGKVDELQAQIDAELEKIRGSISRSSESSIEVNSEMVLLGGSVLKQAEGYNPANGKYYIGVLYYWSRDLQRAAAGILSGAPMKFTPGKKSLAEWIAAKKASGEYDWMLGPRSFIDSDGHMRFLGFAAYPETDNTTKNIQNEGSARLQARAEVGYALFADAYAHEGSQKKLRDRILAENKTVAEKELEYTAKLGESFKNMTISGLGPVAMPKTTSLYGLEANVLAMGVDSSSSTTLADIFRQSQLLGISTRKAQARQLGEDQALRQGASAAQDNAASIAAGAAAGARLISNNERAQPAARPGQAFVPAAAPQAPASSGRLTGGTIMFNDDDDF